MKHLGTCSATAFLFLCLAWSGWRDDRQGVAMAMGERAECADGCRFAAPLQRGCESVRQSGRPQWMPRFRPLTPPADPANPCGAGELLSGRGEWGVTPSNREASHFDGWTPFTNELYADTVDSVMADPVDPLTLYADGHGALYKTTDGGKHWSAVAPPDGTAYIWLLAIDPSRNSTLYAFAGACPGCAWILGELYTSSDGGVTWRSLGPAPSKDELPNLLVVDPKDSSTLYLGDWHGLFKSVDGGRSWTRASRGIAYNYPIILAFDPVDHSVLYLAAERTYHCYAWGSIYKSTDGAATWKEVAFPGAGADNCAITALIVDPLKGSTVFAACLLYDDEGYWEWPAIYRSTDGGDSWEDCKAGLPAKGWIGSVAMDPSNPSTLYAEAGWGSHDRTRVFRTTDSGDNWKSISPWLPATNPWTGSLAVAPVTPSKVYLGTGSRGVFVTSYGAEWRQLSTGLNTEMATALAIGRSNPSTFYVATSTRDRSNSCVYTRNGGSHRWRRAASGLPRNDEVDEFVMDPVDVSRLYALTGSGVFMSANRGASWSPIGTGTPVETGVSCFAVDPVHPSIMYAGRYGTGVLKSTDRGTTWVMANSGLPSQEPHALAITVDPANPSTLYGAVYRDTATDWICQIFKSTDGTASWKLSNNGLKGHRVRSLRIDPLHPSTIYAGTYDDGVHKSTDGGGHWAAVNAGLTGTDPDSRTITSLVIDPANPSTVYAASLVGVFVSTNSGQRWSPILNGAPHCDTYYPGCAEDLIELAVDPADPSSLYASIPGQGVWRWQSPGR